ncbi:MAG: hypothetical protein ACOYL5_08630 [Phototrophicaceae bacterium]
MRTLQRVLCLCVLLTGVLVACRTAPTGQPPPNPENQGVAAITWVRSADEIVFRADVVGGSNTFDRRNDIPNCTIFGDNRIVWTDNSQPGRLTVLTDFLEDINVYDFVNELAINYRFYTYQAKARIQLPSESSPVYELMTLKVNNELHTVDGFESLPTEYFRDLVTLCQEMSNAPAYYEPAAGWLSARQLNYDPEATLVTWSAEASGIDLYALSATTQPLWVANEIVPVLWNISVNTPRNRMFKQGDGYFEVAFEIPNITRLSPPAPSAEELEAVQQIRSSLD